MQYGTVHIIVQHRVLYFLVTTRPSWQRGLQIHSTLIETAAYVLLWLAVLFESQIGYLMDLLKIARAGYP
jgi:hypothetical protein